MMTESYHPPESLVEPEKMYEWEPTFVQAGSGFFRTSEISAVTVCWSTHGERRDYYLSVHMRGTHEPINLGPVQQEIALELRDRVMYMMVTSSD